MNANPSTMVVYNPVILMASTFLIDSTMFRQHLVNEKHKPVKYLLFKFKQNYIMLHTILQEQY